MRLREQLLEKQQIANSRGLIGPGQTAKAKRSTPHVALPGLRKPATSPGAVSPRLFGQPDELFRQHVADPLAADEYCGADGGGLVQRERRGVARGGGGRLVAIEGVVHFAAGDGRSYFHVRRGWNQVTLGSIQHRPA